MMKTPTEFHALYRSVIRYVQRNFVFVLFCASLFMIYIGNRHEAIRFVHVIRVKKETLDSIKWSYMELRSIQKRECSYSTLSKAVEPMGLKESLQPPVILNGKNN